MHTERPKLVTAFRAGQGSPARPSRDKIVHFNASGRLHKGSASAIDGRAERGDQAVGPARDFTHNTQPLPTRCNA